jgi:hypothetical protein
MADPMKTEYTPEELRNAKSNFDPAKVAAEAASAAGGSRPDRSGPPPETSDEQRRRAEEATVEHNDPNRSRDEHLVKVGRGQQTHG